MLRRRELLAGGVALGALAGCANPPSRAEGPLRRIGFASCIDQTAEQPIWDTVLADRPDLFIFGGDNVYCQMPYSLANAAGMASGSARPAHSACTIVQSRATVLRL